ncbi:hypothetical protein ESA94_20330 [Lacibacter luteus]|uniref:Uncharacterized protein n=1 Tax=Lacibacter luteus TaxID=2508719 RepID=A0A4Q1CD82_9BACT|nr:hypothetical protein [Lacibacter luteus]RXK57548.1 hypothetical protein ESA94_20330 [Lacibacter luteus]
MNSRTEFEITGYIELIYDENSTEFKEALEGYKKCIDKTGTKEDMLKHTAFYVTRFGTDGMVEGVGYVGYNGRKPTEEPYSGIMVSEDYDEFEFNER